MELRHLRYVVAVAEELHFGRAAARRDAPSNVLRSFLDVVREVTAKQRKRKKGATDYTDYAD